MLFKKIFLGLTVLAWSGPVAVSQQSKTEYYPGKTWEVVTSPEELGLSTAKLEKAKAFSKTIDTDAVMVVVDGKVAYQWGDVDKKMNTHSVRKSVISAVYGKYVLDGTINRDVTMADLGIDDVEGLTKEEKKATIRDLLKSRSGIYHPALYETEAMKRRKPERHSHAPGTHWYYNNWDFNALGTIFEQLTKKTFFKALYEDIAKPIGMEDYKPSDGKDISGKASVHNAYPFHVTARDLARFGWLMLNSGKWNGQQIIDSAWVKESTRSYSKTTNKRLGYGYLWWIADDRTNDATDVRTKVPNGSYSARGAKGQYLWIIPAYNMVIVHRVNSDIRGRSVSGADWYKLQEMILDAKEQ